MSACYNIVSILTTNLISTVDKWTHVLQTTIEHKINYAKKTEA